MDLDIATPSEVAVLRSYVNVMAIIGRSSGGPIGGILTDTVGWRWYIPFGLLHTTISA